MAHAGRVAAFLCTSEKLGNYLNHDEFLQNIILDCQIPAGVRAVLMFFRTVGGFLSLEENFCRKMILQSCEGVTAGLKSSAEHQERFKIQ